MPALGHGLERLLLPSASSFMRRIDTAEQLATAAREAQQRGEYKRAAALFAQALKVLAQEQDRELADARAPQTRGESAFRGQLPQRWRAVEPEPCGEAQLFEALPGIRWPGAEARFPETPPGMSGRGAGGPGTDRH
jgi:hypothetical protein